MDAGAGRWVAPIAAASGAWPDPAKVSVVRDGRLLIQSMVEPPQRCNTTAAAEAYVLWGNISYLTGTFFGGTPAGLARVETALEALFREMLDGGIVNNEQIALWVLYCRRPGLFNVMPRKFATPRALRLKPWRKKNEDWIAIAANLAYDRR